MELFFAEDFHPEKAHITLGQEESRHVARVYRKSRGEVIWLTDGNGHRIQGEITEIRKGQVEIAIRQVEHFPFPPENRMVVGVAVIRPNRLDWAVEKLTELGVLRIVPLLFRYNTRKQIKTGHLQRVMRSALKQSQQWYLPEISPPALFPRWLEDIPAEEPLRFLAHPNSRETTWSLPLPPDESRTCYLAVGPEGGFHPQELALAQEHHFHLLHLGNTILRTETAAVVGTALLKQKLYTPR